MNERKILLLILFVAVYCFYSVQVWITKESVEEKNEIKTILETIDAEIDNKSDDIVTPNKEKSKKKLKVKTIPLYFKNACSILQIFTQKPPRRLKNKTMNNYDEDRNTITAIGISVFLLVLTINAILDVLKVKEEERARRKLNPDGERRQSLAEFANKKPLRRESSKFGLQLFQIAESNTSSEDEKPKRQAIPYKRGDSTNSYLSETKQLSEGLPGPTGDTSPSEPKLVKRQSVAKLFGGRPVPMVRRGSFPTLPVNPEVQALMLGHRQGSVDSDDEDGRGRRVRFIRRF